MRRGARAVLEEQRVREQEHQSAIPRVVPRAPRGRAAAQRSDELEQRLRELQEQSAAAAHREAELKARAAELEARRLRELEEQSAAAARREAELEEQSAAAARHKLVLERSILDHQWHNAQMTKELDTLRSGGAYPVADHGTPRTQAVSRTSVKQLVCHPVTGCEAKAKLSNVLAHTQQSKRATSEQKTIAMVNACEEICKSAGAPNLVPELLRAVSKGLLPVNSVRYELARLQISYSLLPDARTVYTLYTPQLNTLFDMVAMLPNAMAFLRVLRGAGHNAQIMEQQSGHVAGAPLDPRLFKGAIIWRTKRGQQHRNAQQGGPQVILNFLL